MPFKPRYYNAFHRTGHSIEVWDKFQTTLCSVREQVKSAGFVTLMFDGWSIARNQALIGFIVSTLTETLELRTRCIGNFRLPKSYGSADMSKLITTVVRGRLDKRTPDFFVSDSASGNK